MLRNTESIGNPGGKNPRADGPSIFAMTVPGTPRSNLIDVALAATAANIPVHPPLEDGTKAPDPLYRDEAGKPTWLHPPGDPPNEETLRRWYGSRRGIGVRCGSEAGGLECLDFDRWSIYEGFVAAARECGLGDLVNRIEAGYREETPNRGVHWLYFTDEILGNTKLAKVPEPTPNNPRRVKTLIETKGENGFVIVAPTGGAVHETGKPYVLTSGGFGSIVAITGEERESLWELARSFDRMPKVVADTKTRGRPPADEKKRPGDLFAEETTWSEILTPAGWNLVYQRGETSYWRRPEKKIGISATTNHAGSGFLYVFTSSTTFDSEKSYTKFGAYSALNHGGNHGEAARALRAAGFRSPEPTATPAGGDPKGESEDSPRDAPPEVDEVVDTWPEPDGAAYYGIAGELVRMAEPHTEADPVGVLVQFLAGFASMVGRGPHWHAGADTHYLVMFAALVGPTASGRKGSAWGVARHLLARVDAKWAADCISSGLSSGEGLIHAVRDRVVKAGPEGEEIEVDPGVKDKRLLLIETEFGRTLRVMGRESSTLSQILRQVWDCDLKLEVKTRNSPCKATAAHVSVVGHVSKTELTALLAKNDTAGGFSNRFLWFCVRRSKSIPSGGRFHEINWTPLVERLGEIVEFARTVGNMRRDEETAAIWECKGGVYDDLTKGRPGLLGAILGRPEAQVMRLACIYALLDRSHFVRPAHLRAALAIWGYVEESASNIFGETLADPQAERLLAALRLAPNGLTRSQVTVEVFGGHLKAHVIAKLLEDLLGMGLIYSETRDDGKPGRKPQIWRAGVKFRKPKLHVPEDLPASA